MQKCRLASGPPPPKKSRRFVPRMERDGKPLPADWQNLPCNFLKDCIIMIKSGKFRLSLIRRAGAEGEADI